MKKMNSIIDWNYTGPMDLTVGTGAAVQEKALVYACSAVLPLLCLYWFFTGHLAWSPWQYLLAGLIGADIGAGAVANSLNSCKRFYLTPRRQDEPAWVGLLKNPYLFAALHIYPILVGLLFGRIDWIYGLAWYALLMAAVVMVERVPLYLQRPAAVLTLLAAVLINLYVIQPVPGFEWLMPLLFIKIVLGHTVQEEPYRP